MMTVAQGFEQDLNDILEDAGNPEFKGWVVNRDGTEHRIYQFEGKMKVLKVIESEVAIESHEWIDL